VIVNEFIDVNMPISGVIIMVHISYVAVFHVLHPRSRLDAYVDHGTR